MLRSLSRSGGALRRAATLAARRSLPSAAARPSAVAVTPADSGVRLDVHGNNHLEVTPAIRAYVDTKLGHALAVGGAVVVRLSARHKETQKHSNEQKCELTAHLVGSGAVRVEATESTLYAAIDKAEALLIRGLRDKKERRAKGGVHTHHRMPASINDLLPEQPLELDANRAPSLPQEPLVVRRKVFHVPPMSVEQAVEEMESVGHPFYVFTDEVSRQVQVLYRRNAGGYGILIPKA